jgi:hypothetical protein
MSYLFQLIHLLLQITQILFLLDPKQVEFLIKFQNGTL